MKNNDQSLFNELKEEIRDGKSKVIILKGDDIIRFSLDEIKTFFTLLHTDRDYLKGTIVFVKEVNKSTAALIILVCVKEIYADIISEHAIKLLNSYNIKHECRHIVPFFENKTDSGINPVELLAIPCEFPTEIYVKLDGLLSNIPSDIKGWAEIFR